jgi:hypothetical protein
MANSNGGHQNNDVAPIQSAAQNLPSWITVNDQEASYRRISDRGASGEVHEVFAIAQRD